ncbi:MFS transporter [Pseudomonas sp. Marseille-QA0332]
MNTRVVDGVACLKPTRQRHVLSFILLAVLFFSYIDRVNVSILVVDPAFLTDMGIADQAVQKGMLMTIFLIAYGLGNVILSPLGDLLGARKAMALSIIGWGVALCIGGFALTFTVMLLSRFILGLFEGIHFPMQSKYVKEWYPLSERGRANAMWQAGLSVAPAISMPLVALIIHSGGWRASFFTLALFGLIPLVLIWFFTTDTPRQHKRVNSQELEHIENGLAVDYATAEPQSFIERVKSFGSNYQYWMMVGYYCLHSSIFWGAITWLPSYLKEARGFSWAEMGMLASLPYILSFIAKFISGYLCDKSGRRAPYIFASMIVVVCGVYLGASLTNPYASAISLSLGIGALGFAYPPVWTLIQDMIPSNAIGTGTGLLNGLANGFSALSPLLIGLIISFGGGYNYGLYMLMSFAALAGCLMLVLWSKGR